MAGRGGTSGVVHNEAPLRTLRHRLPDSCTIGGCANHDTANLTAGHDDAGQSNHVDAFDTGYAGNAGFGDSAGDGDDARYAGNAAYEHDAPLRRANQHNDATGLPHDACGRLGLRVRVQSGPPRHVDGDIQR